MLNRPPVNGDGNPVDDASMGGKSAGLVKEGLVDVSREGWVTVGLEEGLLYVDCFVSAW
jgi:hypothetical protein